VFGGLRLLRGRLFLRGQQLSARSLLWTISGSGISSLWTNVACVREMGNLWTTFFFTVMRLMLCGLIFLIVLVCLGLCREELLTCLLIVGSLEGREVLRFGRWCLFAFFGVFGKKEISDVIENLESFMEDILASFFHTLYLWTVAFLSPLAISFADFLVRFSIPS
jgi:hypothetical protein